MHFEEKKALKNTFPQQKKHNEKKKHKKHFYFLKTLAGRTAIDHIKVQFAQKYIVIDYLLYRL